MEYSETKYLYHYICVYGKERNGVLKYRSR